LLQQRGIAANIGPALPRIESDRIADMADYTHTIDRWDEATGENLIEQIAGVTACLTQRPSRPKRISGLRAPSDRPSAPRVWPVAVGHWWVGRALLAIKSIG
jgi:hypothetical protein